MEECRLKCNICRRHLHGTEEPSRWATSGSAEATCPSCTTYLSSNARLSASDHGRHLAELVALQRRAVSIESRAAVAIHEAGHAVMHAALAIGLSQVELSSSGGVVRGAQLRGSRISRQRLWDHICAIAAGPVAENRFLACVYGDKFATTLAVKDKWAVSTASADTDPLSDYELIAGCFESALRPEDVGLIWRITGRYVNYYWSEIVSIGWLLHRHEKLRGSFIRSVFGDLCQQREKPIRKITLTRRRSLAGVGE